MMITELEYVRGELNKLRHSEWVQLAKEKKIGLRTIRRIACEETKGSRSDIVGSLALHFRRRQRKGA